MTQCVEPSQQAAPNSLSSRLSVLQLDDFGDVPGGASAWNSLVEKSTFPNVFRTWEWLTIWWKWFGDGNKLTILSVHDGPTLVGLLPLYVRAARVRAFWPTSTLMYIGAGGPTFPEYLGPIVHRDAFEGVVAALANFVTSRLPPWTAFEFPCIAPDDESTHTLMNALAGSYPAVRWPGDVCPCIALPGTYDELLGRLSSHGRARERRQLRKAKSDCEARLVSTSAEEGIEATLATMTRLSTSSRSRAGQVSPFRSRSYAGFHQDIISTMLPLGRVRVYFLKFADTPVGFAYGYSYDRRYSSFQIGYDTHFDKYSPGDVLHQLIFEELIAAGTTEFDYLRGEESYKQRFANGARRTTNTTFYARRGPAFFSHWLRLHAGARARGLKNRVLSRTTTRPS